MRLLEAPAVAAHAAGEMCRARPPARREPPCRRTAARRAREAARRRPCRLPRGSGARARTACSIHSRQSLRVAERTVASRAEHRPADRLALERGLEQMVVDQVVGRIDALRRARTGSPASRARDAPRRSAARGRGRRSAPRPAGRSRARARPWNTVWSRAVQALRLPPTSSIASAERARVAAAGALEHHMLDEVREAAEDAPARSASRPWRRAQRDRFRAGQRVDRDRQAVRQPVQLGAHRRPLFRSASARPAHRSPARSPRRRTTGPRRSRWLLGIELDRRRRARLQARRRRRRDQPHAASGGPAR